jgi:hypothetical protein
MAAVAIVLSWLVFGELVPLLPLGPMLQRGGICAGWWRGLPSARLVALALLNFVVFTMTGALVWLARAGGRCRPQPAAARSTAPCGGGGVGSWARGLASTASVSVATDPGRLRHTGSAPPRSIAEALGCALVLLAWGTGLG